MLGLYLVPTIARSVPHPITGLPILSREPDDLTVLRRASGLQQIWCHIPAGPLVPFTLAVVQADGLAALDAHATFIKLAESARLVSWMDGDVTGSVLPQKLRDRLTAMGVGWQPTMTRRAIFTALKTRLEPALGDLAYETVLPVRSATITDDFAGTGALSGTDWTELPINGAAGSPSATRVSGVLQVPTNAYRSGLWRRNGTFPDTHYAQIRHLYRSAAEFCFATPWTRSSSDGDGYSTQAPGGTSLGMNRYDNLSGTYLGDATYSALSNLTYYAWRLTSTGSSHQWALDGSPIGSAFTDSTYASGSPAFQINGGGGTADRDVGDDFECSDVVGGGGPAAPPPSRHVVDAGQSARLRR